MNMAILVATMAGVTMLTRFLPFIIFRKSTPAYITYLGNILPPAIIGMLVVYCLKDINFVISPFGIPEIIASIIVIFLQAWKHNAIISILTGTIVYMVLIQLLFS